MVHAPQDVKFHEKQLAATIMVQVMNNTRLHSLDILVKWRNIFRKHFGISINVVDCRS